MLQEIMVPPCGPRTLSLARHTPSLTDQQHKISTPTNRHTAALAVSQLRCSRETDRGANFGGRSVKKATKTTTRFNIPSLVGCKSIFHSCPRRCAPPVAPSSMNPKILGNNSSNKMCVLCNPAFKEQTIAYEHVLSGFLLPCICTSNRERLSSQ